MNFYSASVALLWTTAMGFAAPSTVGRREPVQVRVSLRDVEREAVAARTHDGTNHRCRSAVL
jgi:hypothetical protein